MQRERSVSNSLMSSPVSVWRLSSNADGHSQLEFSDEDGEKILELGVEGSDNPFARMLLTCPHLCIHIQS